MTAVANYGRALEYASDELRNDRGVVMAAVARYGYALRFASAELKADREVAMAAVANNRTALRFASAELHREVVMAAVAQDGDALWLASDELRDDPFFVWFQARTRKQRRWTVFTIRFYTFLFVKKLQRRVEARDNERFETAWAEHRDELTVGVPECVAKVAFQHGWAACESSRKRLRVE